MTFQEQNREFERIALEIKRLRDHNVSFDRDSWDLFFFAEGTLVILALERFLRMILGADADSKDTLQNLLEKASSRKRNLIVLPWGASREDAIQDIVKIRNALMHGNYEQAATAAGLPSKDAYFGSKYIKDVERLFKIMNRIVAQIDRSTGQQQRDAPEWRAFFESPDFLDLSRENPAEKFSPKRLT